MDHQNHDKVFAVNFGLVLAALFGIFMICIIAAALIVPDDFNDNPEALVQLEGRIKPLGTAVTDPSLLLKAAAAKPAREPYTGEQVVAKVCAGCHNSGVLGAAKIGDAAAWAKLKSGLGLEGLVSSAIAGKGNMPARGGDDTLSDDEVRAAVRLMLEKSGV